MNQIARNTQQVKPPKSILKEQSDITTAVSTKVFGEITFNFRKKKSDKNDLLTTKFELPN
jgi:hypothetical protein